MNAYWFQEKGLWKKANRFEDWSWILMVKKGIFIHLFSPESCVGAKSWGATMGTASINREKLMNSVFIKKILWFMKLDDFSAALPHWIRQVFTLALVLWIQWQSLVVLPLLAGLTASHLSLMETMPENCQAPHRELPEQKLPGLPLQTAWVRWKPVNLFFCPFPSAGLLLEPSGSGGFLWS